MPSSYRVVPFFAGITVVYIALATALAYAEPQPESTVTVTVTNVLTEDGFIMAAIYDESGWGKASLATQREPVRGDTVVLSFTVPTPGRYGIRLYHDVDGNGELNANIMGIPTEPFGFSNNAPLQFGPPSFEAAAFGIGESEAAQTIALL